MNLEVIKRIKVDFHDAKYISINAKQHDRASRYILVTCYDNGELYPIDNVYTYAYVRCRKPDYLGVFNSCKVTEDGEILVELTEQMLTVAGKCYADVVIVNNSAVEVSENTGELITNNDNSIISTMTFCINVLETPFDNTEMESSYEYDALNDLLIKATADYSYVMEACKISEDNSKESEINSKESENNAKMSENAASTSESNARTSEGNAKRSEDNAKMSENAASTSENNAKMSEEASFINAAESLDNATLAKSYTIGTTNTRANEDIDNAKYYYQKAKLVSDSISGTFYPMGTITFEELSTVEADVGYVYLISNEFVTDDTFREGAGISHSSGTYVYYTYDKYWDFLTGGTFVFNDVGDCISVSDDNAGNVTIKFFYGSITEDDKLAIYETMERLQDRITELEGQTVLGITE